MPIEEATTSASLHLGSLETTAVLTVILLGACLWLIHANWE